MNSVGPGTWHMFETHPMQPAHKASGWLDDKLVTDASINTTEKAAFYCSYKGFMAIIPPWCTE
eukprot:1428165-Prorocentrum_lima.AAC.1